LSWAAAAAATAPRAAAAGSGYTLRFTYGWDDETNLPLDLSAPENEGDLPTGVWLVAPATANTLLLVR
jgi:hypothetical protein